MSCTRTAETSCAGVAVAGVCGIGSPLLPLLPLLLLLHGAENRAKANAVSDS